MMRIKLLFQFYTVQRQWAFKKYILGSVTVWQYQISGTDKLKVSYRCITHS